MQYNRFVLYAHCIEYWKNSAVDDDKSKKEYLV